MTGYDGPIFDPITTPQSCGGGLGGNGDSALAAIHYISNLLNMCHKIIYTKFGILDWCRCHTKKNCISINEK